ncbi:nitroreductase family protein [Spiractinospora alimapuensis]|uniref:nitroreductase family protein n=1 Tax=Spiractinospora alimapuensis TaxID=2820884 RepID=UPI001F466257|nr:nitroreductase family protein [Spiractinospora alimapuensis]QVQ50239.1 nitroreductase family protein [Spiractinospora alimapuensis]
MNTNPTSDLIRAFADRVPAGTTTRARSRTSPAPLARPIPVPPGDGVQENLLPVLRRRRSTRFFSEVGLPPSAVLDSAAHALETDRAHWPTRHPSNPLRVDAVAFNLEGVPPAIYQLDDEDRALTPVASLPEGHEHELTLQPEFSTAAVVLSVAVDLSTAWDHGGAHEYRLLMGRVSSAAYTMWLHAMSQGHVGSVFAGFIPAAVRRLLHSDGTSRHHAFAVALGRPPA